MEISFLSRGPFLSRTSPSGQPFVIMYHGSLVERNGLDLAVDALARILKTRPQAELRVYGKSTPYLEGSWRKSGELGLGKKMFLSRRKKLEELVQEIEIAT